MGSLKRKMARKRAKKAKKDLNKKIGLFNQLQDECLVCEKPFDKTCKEQVQEWFVTVREEQGVVNLYCPECWGTAQKVIEDYGKQNFSVDK
jgi:hypothetical protein